MAKIKTEKKSGTQSRRISEEEIRVGSALQETEEYDEAEETEEYDEAEETEEYDETEETEEYDETEETEEYDEAEETEEDDEEFDLSFKPVGLGNHNVARSGPGKITVIFAGKCGHRLLIQQTLLHQLKVKDRVYVGVKGESIVLSSREFDGLVPYYLKEITRKKSVPKKRDEETQVSQRVIYSKKMVQDITEMLSLDFTGRVSVTLRKCVIKNIKGAALALVSL